MRDTGQLTATVTQDGVTVTLSVAAARGRGATAERGAVATYL